MNLRWWAPGWRAGSAPLRESRAARERREAGGAQGEHLPRAWWQLPVYKPEVVVLGIGCVVLVGWLFDVSVLKSLSTQFPSMKANTALALALAGAAVLLLRTPNNRLGLALGGAVLLIGALTTAEHAFGRDLRIDQLLFHEEAGAARTVEPGRMSLVSAVVFLLAGGSILLLDARRPRRVRPAQIGAVLIGVCAMLAIAAYLFDAPFSGSGFSGQVTRTALHSALAFLLLAWAILHARPGVGIMETLSSPGAGGTILRRLLPAAAVILLSVGWLRLRGEEAGLYNFRVGLALMVTSAIAALSVFVFLTAQSLERSDRERRLFLQEIESRKAELEAANRELEAFCYSVSHDLRAPLRAIDGFSRILATEHTASLEESGRRYLHMVSDNARAMGALIDGLLAFSRLGQQAVTKRPVKVEGLVQEAIAEIQLQLEGQQVEITVADLPSTLEADPTLLKQVFVNLLSNAVKYTRDRELAHVEVGSFDDGRKVIYVRDNGVGFDMRYAQKLFQVFQRLHRAEEYEGAGIGLALVERIVKRHGGTIWAASEPDRGATFFFTLDGAASP